MKIKEFKKWIPFGLILGIAIIALFDLLLFTEDSYQPTVDDPQIIYYEACASCHSDNANGDGFLYPPLRGDTLSTAKIEDIIVNGSWIMPRFNNIKGDTLSFLVKFIHKQEFEFNK